MGDVGIMGGSARKIWNTFTMRDKRVCYKNDYLCLKTGLYWYETPRYRCGCKDAKANHDKELLNWALEKVGEQQ